jgi:flavorubredoxin
MKTKMFDINVTTALNEVVALINKSSRFIIGSPTINHNAVEPI